MMRLEYVIDADIKPLLDMENAASRMSSKVEGSFTKLDKAVNDYVLSLIKSGYKISENGRVMNAYGQVIDGATSKLARLKQAQEQYNPMLNKTSQAVSKATADMRGMNGVMGNLGFQLQDIAVQAQMGTNAFVILGQQGSQIAGAFGPGGAVLGAFIAIGAAILHVATGTEEANKALEGFQDAMANLDDEDLAALVGEKQANAFDYFTGKVKESESQLDSLYNTENKIIDRIIELDEAIAKENDSWALGRARIQEMNKEKDKLTNKLSETQMGIQHATDEVVKYNRSVDILNGTLRVTAEEQSKANEAIASTITNLQTQAAVIGMTAKGAALYRLELMGATEEQKQAAAAALDLIQAEKDRQAAEKASIQVSRERSKQQKQSEKDMESLNKKLEKLTNERLLLESKQTEANRTLDPYQQELDKYKAKMQALENYKNSEFYVEQRYRDMALQAETQHQESIRALQEETFRNMSGGNALLLDTFNSLENAATNVFSGMLSGTMSATDAMKAFGNAILNEAIGALVKMGVEQLKQAVIGKSMQAASTAAAVAQGAAIAAAMQPAAMAASIATSGAAAAAGMSGYTSAMASAMIPVAGGRLYGGPTQAGKMYRVNENGRPEFFQTSSGQSYMMSGQAGHVTSAKDIGGGNVVNITNEFVFNNAQDMTPRTVANIVEVKMNQWAQNQMRQGGLFS